MDITLDGGQTWQPCTNGQPIPGITPGMDISKLQVMLRQTLQTADIYKTPTLQNLTLSVLAEIDTMHTWQPGQLVRINLPDRGVDGEFLIQRVQVTPTTPNLWTYRIEYGGRLLGIADFLQALVSAHQKRRHIEPTQSVQKYIYSEDALGLRDELQVTTRDLPYICGDVDAVCGMVVVSDG